MGLGEQIGLTERRIACMQALQAQFRDDPQRPRYHFMPPSSWMNDINGAIYWKGRYHIFYQHNPEGAWWKWMQWGHASSVDLVHWVHHPIALTPDLHGPDRDGCFSGGAFVSKGGVPTFIYYGVPDGVCLATADDDLLLRWTKHPANPVIPEPQPGQPGYGEYTTHDPCAWRQGDTYYAAVNNRNPAGRGDCAFLFRSNDLEHWEYRGRLYESQRRWTEADEDCAVPDFFDIGSKQMLFFASHLQSVQYYIGKFEHERLAIERHGRLGWPGSQLGGPRTLLDGQGRRIYLDWIRELRGTERERASGWSGVMSLPKVFDLAPDGSLRIAPAPELQVLRLNERRRVNLALADGADMALHELRGEALELELDVAPGTAQQVGVALRCSPDGAEQTAVLCDLARGVLAVDVSRSTLDPAIHYAHFRSQAALQRLPENERYVSAQEAPFRLLAGEALRLRIYLDRSVLEVFANDRQTITQRIYPTRADSLGVRLFARGGSATVNLLRAWDMAPAHA